MVVRLRARAENARPRANFAIARGGVWYHYTSRPDRPTHVLRFSNGTIPPLNGTMRGTNMAGPLPGHDNTGQKQVKFRADTELVDRFDEWAEEAHGSRAAALRAVMADAVDHAPDSDGPEWPRKPPAESPLGDAYRSLCATATDGGYIPDERATSVLAEQLRISQDRVTKEVLHQLRNRGYLRRESDWLGHGAWYIRGWDHNPQQFREA